MSVASELAVRFTADTSGLEAGGTKATGVIGSIADKLGKLGLAGMGVGIVKDAVGAIAGSFGGLIEAAEAAGDAKARLDIVLGSDLSAVVEDNASIANSLGMTKTAYLEAAGAASNYLVNLGLSKDAAGEMAVGLTDLAPKLAAFTGADPSAVTDALQKGVGGATRGLKELGIAIDTEAISKLPKAAQAAAIYEQILAQSGGAQQAWADNQGDVANSMARISAAMDDAKASIGEKLLPVLAPLVETFAIYLPDAIAVVTGAFDRVSSVVGPVVERIAKFAEGLMSSHEWSSSLGETIATLTEEFFGLKDGALQPVADAINGFIDLLKTFAANFQAFFDSTASGGQTFRNRLVEVWANIKDAVGRVVDWFNANVKPILIGVFETVRSKLAELKQQFDDKFGGIRGAVQAVIDWFSSNVAPTMAHVFDEVMAVIGPVVAFLRAHMDEIKAIIGGAIDFAVGVFRVGFNLLKGIAETVMAAIRGDWSGAWEAIKQTVANVVPGIRQALGGLWDMLRGLGGMALDAALGIGTAIVDGIKRGIGNAWDSVTSWVNTQINKLPAGVRKILGIASPSRVFVEIGEQVVAGLRIGLEGIAIIGAIIQDGLAKSIGAMDVENFEMIHRLTSAILGIFKDAAEGIRSLLEFDIVTTADEIAAAFDRLVGVFEVALGRMAELSKFAGRGTQPGQEGFINLDHINNIERYTAAIEQTIGVASGTLDILEKLSNLTMPGAGAITALIPFLQEVANAAAVFEQPLGKDEDAIAVFERGAIVAGHMANFAKSVADLAALKFGQISTAFASEVNAAAAAAGQVWAAASEAARLWGDMESMARDKLIVGVKAYAEAVGAAVSILKGAAELDFEDVTFATATQLAAAAQSAADALVSIMAAAKWWIDAPKEAAKVVEGVKAYAEAAGAAVGLLKSAGDLDFSEAVAVTSTDLGRAASAAERALEAIAASADWWSRFPEEAAKVVAGVKAYADAAGAAVGLLGSAGALDFSKAVAVTSTDLGRAADVAEMAYEELRRIAAGFIDMGEEMTGPIVAGIKAFADAAGAALDLLAKGASGMNALGEIKKLAGVQPRLIRQIMAQLAYIVNAVAAEVPTVPEETVTRLKGLADLAGVFDPLAKAAEGMNALGEVKRLAGVQPRLIRAILAGVNAAVSEVAAGAGSFGTEAIAKVKAWGEASAVTLGALTTAADGLNKMSAKLTIPDDLSARVAALVTAMRIVVDSMADALDAGAIRLDVAKAGADVAAAVGAIADAMGPVFDAINAAISSPFGRIRATGQRGDTFRQNIANRIRASIVAAVTAISDALKELPTINVPDELVTQVDKLASVYERILDVVERLGEVRVDMRAVTALSAAMATLAGGVAAGAPGGAIAVTAGGSGTTLTVSSGPGGGIEITNVYSPTVTPMPVTISTTNNINIGQRTIETIATEVKILQELELRQGQTT